MEFKFNTIVGTLMLLCVVFAITANCSIIQSNDYEEDNESKCQFLTEFFFSGFTKNYGPLSQSIFEHKISLFQHRNILLRCASLYTKP